MMLTGLYIERLCVIIAKSFAHAHYARQNIAAVSSDEEEDFVQLQAIEQKLLAYDPHFTTEHTHASITTQRSALLSAFRPRYPEGDVEGLFNCREPHADWSNYQFRKLAYSPERGAVESVRDLVLADD